MTRIIGQIWRVRPLYMPFACCKAPAHGAGGANPAHGAGGAIRRRDVATVKLAVWEGGGAEGGRGRGRRWQAPGESRREQGHRQATGRFEGQTTGAERSQGSRRAAGRGDLADQLDPRCRESEGRKRGQGPGREVAREARRAGSASGSGRNVERQTEWAEGPQESAGGEDLAGKLDPGCGESKGRKRGKSPGRKEVREARRAGPGSGSGRNLRGRHEVYAWRRQQQRHGRGEIGETGRWGEGEGICGLRGQYLRGATV